MSCPTYIFVRSELPVDELPDGAYRAAVRGDGTRGATIRCPTCHRTFSLAPGHTVAPNGAIHPSVVCTFKCGFHVQGVLTP